MSAAGSGPQCKGAFMASWKLMGAGAIAALLACAPAQGAPLGLGGAIKAQGNGAVETQWRGGGWGWGPGVWLGLGAGVVAGAIIANEAYRPRPGYYYDDSAYDGPYYYPPGYHGDPRVICARSFRSFEWQTGLYTTHSGEKRLCPYLR
jgi:hypothetical protein